MNRFHNHVEATIKLLRYLLGGLKRRVHAMICVPCCVGMSRRKESQRKLCCSTTILRTSTNSCLYKSARGHGAESQQFIVLTVPTQSRQVKQGTFIEHNSIAAPRVACTMVICQYGKLSACALLPVIRVFWYQTPRR